MTIHQGLLTWPQHRLLMEVLTARTTFESLEDPHTNRSYLELRTRDHDCAGALKKALLSGLYEAIGLYAYETNVGTKRVLIGQHRGEHKPHLIYPDGISTKLENSMLLAVGMRLQKNLIGYLWELDGGAVYVLLFPLLGVFSDLFGYVLTSVIRPDSPAPHLAGFIIGFMGVLGILIALAPFIGAWRKRRSLVKAINAMYHDATDRFREHRGELASRL